MKKFTFFTFLMLFVVSVFAQTRDLSPTIGKATISSQKSTASLWTLQFGNDISTQAWGPYSYGIESDGTNLFISKYNANKFYRLTTAGALVDSFSVAGTGFPTGGIRDLAYDGTYFYGSNFTNVVCKMDFTTHMMVSTITLPTGFLVRHIAYDPTANSGAGGLWVGPWNGQGPRLYSMTGVYLDSIPAANLGAYSASGSAFDNITPGGPYLWLYSQPATGNTNELIQIKISTKQKVLTHDLTQEIPALSASSSGGLFQKTNLIAGTTTLGGLCQGLAIWGINLASTIPPLNGMQINTLNLLGAVQINTPQTLAGMLSNLGSTTVTSFNLNYSINGGANVTQNLTGLNIAGLATYNYSHSTVWTPATAGTYTVKLWASNINGNAALSSDTITKTVNAMATLVFQKVVLEEYTGIHCQYCPDGHKKANDYKALHPNDVFIINLHQGGYATPAAGEPDFRTSFGDALATQTGLTGYPAATINRHVFSPLTVTATSDRAQWPVFGDQVLATPTYASMNITSASVDVQTRILTVSALVNYIGAATTTNMLNIALLQNNVEGPQTAGATYNPAQVLPNGNYLHGHMLRHLLTGQWGDTVTTTTAGSNFTKTYTYTLPADINLIDLDLGNIEIVGFVVEGKQNIITGAEKNIALTNIMYAKDISIESITAADEICNPKLTPTIKIKNLGSDTVTAISFTYNINGGTALTYNWAGILTPYASKSIDIPAITGFSVLVSNAITIGVVNVNGVVDQNAANNSKTKSGILKTTNNSSGASGHVFTFTQDRYGSESTWKITDDATSTIVAQGGPYADLAANGVLAHPVNVNFSATGCYTVTVVDAYGDGINAGYGAGSYQLVNAANQVVISSNGQFATGETKLFELTSLVGIEENTELSVFSLTPNPAKDNVQLSFNLNNSKEVNVSIFNSLGAVVYSQTEGVLTSGNHRINLKTSNLSSGIYYMNVKAGDNTITKKLVIE